MKKRMVLTPSERRAGVHSSGSRLFLYYWLPVLLYCLLIFLQSSFPAPSRITPPLPHGDKILHAAGYALLGFLSYRAFHASFPNKSLSWTGRISFFSSFFYAGTDELHQTFVSCRQGDLWDLAADAVGVWVGVRAGMKLIRIRVTAGRGEEFPD